MRYAMNRNAVRPLVFLLVYAAAPAFGQAVVETPARPGEWGFRPPADTTSARNPPSFCWRPQEGAASYTLQIARSVGFDKVEYEASRVGFNVHCPTRRLDSGGWFWRFRFENADGRQSSWSSARRFTIPADAVVFPLPPRAEILARVPDSHPRLFLRPEDVSRIRASMTSELKESFGALIKRCDQLIKDPPDTAEPPKYPRDMKRGSDPWRKVWWQRCEPTR